MRLARRAGPPVDALAFQDEIDALVGAPAPLLLRLWPALAGGLVLALVLLAAVLRVDMVVAAPGRLAADVPPVVLQPAAGAVLRELRVVPGQAVRAGEVVATLDPTFTAADRAALEAQRRALAAQAERLRAELGGTATGAEATEEAALQGALRDQRGSLLAAKRAALGAEIDGLRAAFASEQASGAALSEQLGLAREIESMRLKLAEQKIGSHLSVLEARSARLAAEEETRRHAARLDDLAHRLATRAAERDAFLDDWRRQVLAELSRVGPELARVEEQLAKADRLDALTELRAPRDGVVLEVARRAPGSLMREGEAVVTLVPSGVPLIAEVSLRSADVGRLREGDAAVLKIDAFPWRRHGKIIGRLRSVSQESYAPEGQSAAMHRGQVTLDPASVPEGERLLPGMTLQAELRIGTRSVLDFFLDPLMRGFQESLREP